MALCLCFVLPSCVEELALCLGCLPPSCVEVVSFVEFLSGDSKNPSRGEGGDVELGSRTSKPHLLSLSLNSTLVISCIVIIVHTCMFDIVYVLTLVLYQESY